MNSTSRGVVATATGVVLALFGIWGGVGAITPKANDKPASIAVYDEP